MKADLTCNGNNTGAITVGPTGGSPSYSYLWSPGGQTTQTASNLAAGTYSVTVTDSKSCTEVLSNIVIAEPAAINLLSASTPSPCGTTNAGSANVKVQSGGVSPFTFGWSPGGQTNDTATALGAATYTVTVTDNNGCTNTATAIVTASGSSSIVADFGVFYEFSCDGGATVTFVDSSSGATTLLWKLSDGTTSTASNFSHKFNFGQTFTVTLIASNGGCSDTTVQTISIPAMNNFILNTPNVFTPNNDGQNDCFLVKVGNNLEKCIQLTIFDRWGLRMYETENGICWDGRTSAGSICPEGTYFYIVKIGDTESSGSVTLLR